MDMKSHCPICLKKPSESSNIVRNGSYRRKSDSQLLQRYFCRTCKKSFSTATHNPCYGQKRRRLNKPLRDLLVSGVSLRRAALLLRCNRKTVERKFRFLAQQARLKIEKDPARDIREFQFDDMETFEHSKCKPLSITIAVEKETRRILDFEVSQIAAKGHLAKIARKKYGVRIGNRGQARDRLFQRLTSQVHPESIIWSDKDPHYPKTVKTYFPKASHVTTKGRRGCVVGQGELKSGKFDPLFSLNQTAAMLRANMNRLFRRTWCTTKTIQGLIDHIYIYFEFHNSNLISSTS